MSPILRARKRHAHASFAQPNSGGGGVFLRLPQFSRAFYPAPDAGCLQQRPAGADRTRNAYLAATCDYLCNRYDLRKPAWLLPSEEDESLVAQPPYFASDDWKTRVWLLADSPQEFRQRQIFIGADALSRA